MITKPLSCLPYKFTSLLDGETEADVLGGTQAKIGSMTVILIAHPLSVDVRTHFFYYIKSRKLRLRKKFNEIESRVPVFYRQVELMGLE